MGFPIIPLPNFLIENINGLGQMHKDVAIVMGFGIIAFSLAFFVFTALAWFDLNEERSHTQQDLFASLVMLLVGILFLIGGVYTMTVFLIFTIVWVIHPIVDKISNPRK